MEERTEDESLLHQKVSQFLIGSPINKPLVFLHSSVLRLACLRQVDDRIESVPEF